jgi:Ser/Thr protein kinase RdoA (MazF antagonist)
MRLDRLLALAATVGADGTSPLADAAAALWGMPAGSARYVGTSATFVFAAGDGYLRLIPMADRPVDAWQAVAEVTAAMGRAGAPVAVPRPTRTGALVESLQTTAVGAVHAMLIEAAPGRRLAEPSKLTVHQAEQWGRAIAELHRVGGSVEHSRLPTVFDVVADVLSPVSADTQLIDVAGSVLHDCVAALGPPLTLVHGDPQVDNAGWSTDGPVFYDLDDASVSWAVTDLAMAVRDTQPIDRLDTPATSSPIGRALLRGYRDVAGLDADQERAIPLVQRLGAAIGYGRLSAVLAAPGLGHEPDGPRDLRKQLRALADRLRGAL